jgi:hypothetical protein
MGMSNGVWVSSACTAIMKITKPDELGDEVRVAEAVEAEDLAPAWAATMPCRFMRAGLDDHADHGEHHRQLVGDELAGGTQTTEQEYLLADDQPAISMPSELIDDTARA